MNPTVDLGLEVDQLVDTGKKRARQRSVTAGGGGINVARALRLFGGSATAVHTAGREVGRRLNRLLDEEGLDHVAVATEGETREAFVLLETGSGRSYHIVPPGPRLTEDEGRRCLDELSGTAGGYPFVVLSGSLPEGLPDGFYAEAVRIAKAAGARVLLDTSGAPLEEALAEGVFLVKPNRREAGKLLGRPVDSFEDARVVNDQLLQNGSAEIVVTTIGALGALCSSGEGHTEVHAPPLPGLPLSDAGAGDSMMAALTHRLGEGDGPVAAATFGVATAGAAVLTAGNEIFDRSVVDDLLPAVHTTRKLRL